jgi:type IV pilus assembly protein PilC
MAVPSGRLVEKTLTAETKGALERRLEEEGNFVFEIKRAEGLKSVLKRGPGRRRLKSKEFLAFNQEFAVLVKAGLPVISALDAIIERGGQGELKEVLQEVRNDVAGGESLSRAFEKYPGTVSRLYVASIQAGEKSGNIALALTRHIEYLKKVAEIKQKVITASVYPAILTVVSVFALLFLLIYVVPTFTKTYFESGAQLPGLTLGLVTFSQWVKDQFFLFVSIGLGLALAFSYIRKTERGRMTIDRFKIRVPFLGSVYLHYALSKMARTLCTLLGGGTPLLEGVRIASRTLDNELLKGQLNRVGEGLEQGEGLSEGLARTRVFPPLAVRMIAAGEGSGALEQVLDDMAQFYERDVDARLAVLTSAIEPALMIVMGLLIGFVVLAMYLPIFQMAGSVG